MEFIKASEIREFIYCERAWWLRQRNYFGKLSAPDLAMSEERMEQGTQYHESYFSDVRRVESHQRKSRTLFAFVGLLLLLAAILLLFLGRAQGASGKHRTLPDKHAKTKVERDKVTDQPLSGVVAPIVALTVACSAVCLIIALLYRRSARRRRRTWNMPAGSATAIDGPTAETLSCPVLGLVGKIDVVWEGSSPAPEEIKSGSLRPGLAPYPSDVLQLTAYCYLLNQKYPGKVLHGILKYRNSQHRIPFSATNLQLLTQTLGRIRAMRSVANVPRSHNVVARCDECVAKNMCYESLARI